MAAICFGRDDRFFVGHRRIFALCLLSYFVGAYRIFFRDGRRAEWQNGLMTTSLPQREQVKIEKLLAQIIKLKAAASDDRPKGGTPRAKNLSSAAPWHLES